MFIGEHQHNLDAKGRMIVPAKFRDELGQTFIISKGLDKCICVYPLSEWKIIEDKLHSLPLADAGARRFQRFMLGGAFECEPDNQGRVIIPAPLREYASINKDLVSMGLGNRIELWSKDNWESYNSDDGNSIDEELSNRMSALGI
ncbi:MAG: division/cell wall cluster transcriptional repressor MraZ [Clostridiales bacterium]|jgi:MraZ protein|nr:division/cell wall cluster transcriptional repressor MraZ [Clostridiales bacterium]